MRKRRWPRWLNIIAAVLAALFLFLFFVELVPSLPTRTTGDPLYDRYIRAVRDRYSWRLYFSGVGRLRWAPYLPERQLAGWETDFGQDARYWELRYFNSLADLRRGGIVATYSSYPTGEMEFLERAAALGSFPAAVLLSMEKRAELEYDDFHDQREQEQRQYAKDAPERRARLEEVNAQYNTQRLELVEALVADKPDQAWAHYLKAGELADLGETSLALQSLRQGNLARQNDFPCALFPVSHVRGLVKDADWLDVPGALGNSTVAGSIMTFRNLPEPNFIRLRKMRDGLFKQAMLDKDFEPLDDYMHCLSRMGESPGISPLAVVVVLQGAARSCDLVVTLRDDISSKQRATLLKASKRFAEGAELAKEDRALTALQFAYGESPLWRDPLRQFSYSRALRIYGNELANQQWIATVNLADDTEEIGNVSLSNPANLKPGRKENLLGELLGVDELPAD